MLEKKHHNTFKYKRKEILAKLKAAIKELEKRTAIT